VIGLECRDDIPIPKMERDMSGRTIEDFFDDAEAFDALSDEDKARLMAGDSLEGETEAAADSGQGAEDGSATPDAATVTEEDSSAEQEPVVLAKDGKHTIPFSELEAARERARQLEQEVQALKGSAPPAEEPEGATPPAEAPNIDDEMRDLRRQYREALWAGDSDLADSIEEKIDAKERERTDRIVSDRMAVERAESEAKAKAQAALADVEARAARMLEKYPFLDPANPAVNRDAIDLVIAKRDKLMLSGVAFGDAVEQAVAKVAPLFDKGSTKQGADVAAKAAEAISKAKAQVPTSLSQVPAGARAHHDEGEAIREMDINQLSRSLESKTPDEIMRLMNKVL
jgi:hypothetical protein